MFSSSFSVSFDWVMRQSWGWNCIEFIHVNDSAKVKTTHNSLDWIQRLNLIVFWYFSAYSFRRFMRWEFRAYSSKKLLHFLREKMSSLLLFIKFVLTATTNSWKWSVQCQTWWHFIISQQWDSSKVVLHYFPFEQLFVRDCGVVTRDASNHPRRKYFAETRHRVVKKGKDRKNVLSIVLFD